MKKILIEALEKNIQLSNSKLVIQSFGNLSIRIDNDLIAIKPSGVNLTEIKQNDIAVVDLNGNHTSGLKPSVDTPTHTYLYKNYPDINSIVHTHSMYATSWAQSLMSIPPLGTTHSDYIKGELPCTRPLRREEIEKDYEENTGIVIKETIQNRGLEVNQLPGILVGSHGVFSWGFDSSNALNNAEIIEYTSMLAYQSKSLDPKIQPIEEFLNEFHFNRKHGSNGYYGQ